MVPKQRPAIRRVRQMLGGLAALSASYGCSGQVSGPAGNAGLGAATPIDLDGDGINDGFDTDGDGVIDNTAIDTDGDGITDGFDADGDGVVDTAGVDSDGDGVVDAPLVSDMTATTNTDGTTTTDTTTDATNPDAEPLVGTDPGRVMLHRLNTTEYRNTLRDLLEIDATPTLPEDGIVYGFDNIDEAMKVTPAHVVAYEGAARDVIDQALDGASRSRVINCELSDAACRDASLRTFLRRAWRKPVNDIDVNSWLGVFDQVKGQGATDEEAFRFVLSGVLTSPYFLFKVEVDPQPTSTTPHAVTDHELASRLSYFVWSSMPDDALLDAADAGLNHDAALSTQVARLLADPKANRLTEDFAEQWLKQRHLIGYSPSLQVYPEFDEDLSLSARQETSRFFQYFLDNNLPVSQFLSADFSFINPRLATNYGMSAPGGDFQQVTLPADRRGLLTQTSILLANSAPDRSSIVKRGVWIMSNLLCQEPPPPPAVVETAEFDSGAIANQRERLEAHRTIPACAACHALFDPAGVALENYDGIGRWRDTDGGQTVDATGTLEDPAGVLPDIQFTNGVELATQLASDPRFSECLSEKLFVYGIGRGATATDAPYLNGISQAAGADANLKALITQVVMSDPFRQRRGE